MAGWEIKAVKLALWAEIDLNAVAGVVSEMLGIESVALAQSMSNFESILP